MVTTCAEMSAEHTCTKHEPGSLSCHRHDGCRCQPCVQATRRARKISRAGLTALTDATPAKRHIDRLIAAGHTACSIAYTAGLEPNLVHYIHRTAKRTRPAVIAAILAVHTPEGHVSSAGTRRRLHALATLGWPLHEIGARLGVGETTVSHWALRERVATTTATKVARLYEELWDQPGPSTRTRQRAERLKWAPPLAWDDGAGPHGIDNPKARPYPWKRWDSDRRRSRHDISDLRAAGLTDTEIAHRLGIQPESLQRRHAA